MENFPRPLQRIDPEELKDRQAFLSATPPFHSLPQAEIETIAANLAENTYPNGHNVFVQEETLLFNVLILHSGRLERRIKTDDGPEVTVFLEPGGIYGGISLLFNNGISTSTVRCVEASAVYELDRENFLRLCVKYPDFSAYFSRELDKNREEMREAVVAEIAGPAAEAEPGT